MLQRAGLAQAIRLLQDDAAIQVQNREQLTRAETLRQFDRIIDQRQRLVPAAADLVQQGEVVQQVGDEVGEKVAWLVVAGGIRDVHANARILVTGDAVVEILDGYFHLFQKARFWSGFILSQGSTGIGSQTS